MSLVHNFEKTRMLFSNLFHQGQGTNLDLFSLYVCECLLACAPHVCCVCADQKRRLEPLELKLKMALSHCMGAQDQTQSFYKNIKSMQLQSLVSSPRLISLANSGNIVSALHLKESQETGSLLSCLLLETGGLIV